MLQKYYIYKEMLTSLQFFILFFIIKNKGIY